MDNDNVPPLVSVDIIDGLNRVLRETIASSIEDGLDIATTLLVVSGVIGDILATACPDPDELEKQVELFRSLVTDVSREKFMARSRSTGLAY